jgi:hypothetical protein
MSEVAQTNPANCCFQNKVACEVVREKSGKSNRRVGEQESNSVTYLQFLENHLLK